ncbi:MAG: hypothetical protein ACI9VO_000151 [Colwellia sp.]|jgi:hypothetical protein
MKLYIKKNNLLVVILAATLFSTVVTAAVPKAALVKAEPVNQTQLTTAAHNSLKLSLAPIKVMFTPQSTDFGLVKKKQTANQNMSIVLTKASLIAE